MTETLVVAKEGFSGRNDTPMKALCATPCVVDLPFGWHEIKFKGVGRAVDTSFVVTTPAPTAYRHDPGEWRPRTGIRALGSVALGVGLPALALGTVAAVGMKEDVPDGARQGAVAAASAGGGLVVLGAVLLALFPRELQPSSSRQWELEAR